MSMREENDRRRNRTMQQAQRGGSTAPTEVIYLPHRRAPEREMRCQSCGRPFTVRANPSANQISTCGGCEKPTDPLKVSIQDRIRK